MSACKFCDDICTVVNCNSSCIYEHMEICRIFNINVVKVFVEAVTVCITFLNMLASLFFVPVKLLHKAGNSYFFTCNEANRNMIWNSAKECKGATSNYNNVSFFCSFEHGIL